jgi:hypothetical protein
MPYFNACLAVWVSQVFRHRVEAIFFAEQHMFVLAVPSCLDYRKSVIFSKVVMVLNLRLFVQREAHRFLLKLLINSCILALGFVDSVL